MDEWMDCTIGEYLIDDDDTNNSTDMMPHLTTSYKRNSNAWISLALGIISSLAWIIPILGLPITLVGSVLGGIGTNNKRDRGVAVIGCSMNLVFLIVTGLKVIHSSNKRIKLGD
ncbi:MAG: hypothetical protein ATN34_03510 [Epulopiscium sp. Nele67-Bin002]|nr:MAG: hypothetical protein BEN18_05770 [Epulopiscium sp. Nuni2H_MBin001]OON92218.1 MAG: hypothetical protein ATN34_03510 [Epulopiscium sp. Nele67-Bin002]OON93929.1 MAG: hypothetical protein ATN33_05065 [Epulopiscium sp. Nele67-Bin001]